MQNYVLKLTRNEALTIIAGLQKEMEYQHTQAATYRRNSSMVHFASYHNQIKKTADNLIDKLLTLPGMTEANNQALLDRVGREPEFIIALAIKAMEDEKHPAIEATQNQCRTALSQ